MKKGNVPYTSNQIIRFVQHKKDWFWARERERQALKLFRHAARRVPAYRDFLRKRSINPERIKTFKDFQLVPAVNKNNYLKRYPLEKLSWDGTLKVPLVWTATSGSTGNPTYFPRAHQLDWEYSILSELYLKNSSHGKKDPILLLVCLGMGVWIAGVFSYQAFKIAAEREGMAISILTPGINKKEVFNALRKLSPHFKQTVLLGYPPFLKDIIDEADDEGIRLSKLNIRFLSGAEAFTEKFRDYLVKKAGIKNLYLDTLNIYGTADLGTMAYETPAAILFRRLALKSKKLFEKVFSSTGKTPTLTQYNPLFVTFEAPGGDILITGNSVMPLVRYDIGDHGGTFNFEELSSLYQEFDVDIHKEARKVGIVSHIYELPFVYVYERSDLSTTIYGLQVYPEVIREALIHRAVSKYFTGKFTMLTRYDSRQNQYLEVNVELKRGINASVKARKYALKEITSHLRNKNSEFRELSDHINNRAIVNVVLWPQGHKRYFKSEGKQRWVKK